MTPDPAKPCEPTPGSRYLTYPHCNGFCADGSLVVIEALASGWVAFIKIDGADGTREQTLIEKPTPNRYTAFDIAAEAGKLTYFDDIGLQCLDLEEPQRGPRLLYRAQPGETLQDLPSISPDGRRAIAGYNWGEQGGGFVVVDTESARVLARRQWPWHANHFHFCPHDPAWIGFSHEGPALEVSDRVHAWHANFADDGPCVLDQTVSDGEALSVGHERWCFHETSAIVVAYGVSAGGPRGIWQTRPSGSPPSLISEGQRDWHVNISQCGHLAVVDTSGPSDAAGRGWDNAGDVSDIILVDIASGQRMLLARTRRGPGHPYHPHPTFSPEGTHVFYTAFDQSSGTKPSCTVKCIDLSATQPANAQGCRTLACADSEI